MVLLKSIARIELYATGRSTSQAPSRHTNCYQIVSSNNMRIEKQFHKLYVEVNLFNLWFFKYQIKMEVHILDGFFRTVSNWHSSLRHEFGSPEVTKIVTDCTHNFLLFDHLLQVHIVPTKEVHPKL
ncbi:uncharacterized protein LOC113341467 [Papaver somniferum]|uniref:uncharacterized protein LOC113341467 n=1 Tax=Papaver somniferum TaxID=3469 RepID=UPI000E6F8CDF|nr:uncharacterized protein LOC113341467 [Papaver somniferum]